MPLNDAPTICFLAMLTSLNMIFFTSSAELPSILTIIPCLAGRIDVPQDILPLTSNTFIFSLISYWRAFVCDSLVTIYVVPITFKLPNIPSAFGFSFFGYNLIWDVFKVTSFLNLDVNDLACIIIFHLVDSRSSLSGNMGIGIVT